MKKLLPLIILLASIPLFSQMTEEKKEREPVFVLPDVVITGESEIKVGGEKKDLLPDNYPLPPKETPMMELQFIKGPYLDNDRSSPELAENKESKRRLAELLMSYGSFTSLYGKLMYGDWLDKYSYLLKVEKDIRHYYVTDNGYDTGNISLDVSASFDKALDTSLSLLYREGAAFKTSPTLAYTSDEYRDSLMEADISLSSNDSRDRTLKGALKLSRLTLDHGTGYIDDCVDVILGGDFRIMSDGNSILGSAGLEVRNDTLFNQIYLLTAEAKFKLEPVAISAGIRFDHYKLNPAVTASLEVDGNTTLYASYRPGLVFPKTSELYKFRPAAVNTTLAAENDWFSLYTGIQHKIIKDMPVSFEIFRKEVENLVTYESRNDLIMPVNISSATMLGLNLTEQWNIMTGLKQSLKYTFVNTANGTAGKYVPYIPQQDLLLGGEYTDSGWEFLGTFEFKSEMNFREDLPDTLPARFSVGAKITKSLTDWFSVFVEGENLLNQNEELIKGHDLSGAFISIGLNAKF